MFDLCNGKVFGGAVPCDLFNVARRCFPALKFCDRVGLEPSLALLRNVLHAVLLNMPMLAAIAASAPCPNTFIQIGV